MKIAVTGSLGQLGMELLRQYEVEPDSVVGLDLPEFDLTDRNRVLESLDALRPDAIVNTAAFTLVDKAEQQPDACRRVNVEGVQNLVEACRRLGCTLVQISTDYVFGRDAARRAPYRETDEPGPQGVYGQTKLDGERAAAAWPKHLIVRTCGLYGRLGKNSPGNFVETMLRLAAAGRPLRVVDDQLCAPTYVPHLARAIRFLVSAGVVGAVPRGQRRPDDLVRVCPGDLSPVGARRAGRADHHRPIRRPGAAASLWHSRHRQVPCPGRLPVDAYLAGGRGRVPRVPAGLARIIHGPGDPRRQSA